MAGIYGREAYIRIFTVQHDLGYCPDDPALVAQMTNGNEAEVKRGWEAARALCQVQEDGTLISEDFSRLTGRRQLSDKQIEANRLRGQKGGRPRKVDPATENQREKDRQRKAKSAQGDSLRKTRENPAENPAEKPIKKKEDRKLPSEAISASEFSEPVEIITRWWSGHGVDDPHGLLANPKSDAWAIASLTLLGVSAKLESEPPTAIEVKRYLAKSSPLQVLVRHYAQSSAEAGEPPNLFEGCRKAAALAAWSMRDQYGPNDWSRIASQRAALEAKMRDAKQQSAQQTAMGKSARQILESIDDNALEGILP